MPGFLEKYSYTQEQFKDVALRPISLHLGVRLAMDMIAKHFENDGFFDITINDTFNDAFAKKNDLEYTITGTQYDGGTLLNVFVYCETKIGKSRKALRNEVMQLREIFKNYLGEKI